MVNLVHNDYDKIYSTIMWINNEYILKMCVDLSHTNKKMNNPRENYHKEIGYTGANGFCVNINLDPYFYLSIESSKRSAMDNRKMTIRIYQDDMYLLLFRLNEACEWFTSDKYSKLFVKNDNKIMFLERVNNIKCGLRYDYLEFEPAIMTNTNNGEQEIGVKLYLGADNIFTFINAISLLNLNHFLQHFNIYQAGLSLLSYLGRPEYGTNYINMDNSNNNNNNKPKFLT